MYTDIRTAITTVGKTVTSAFYYKKASNDTVYPFVVYSFFGNPTSRTTKDEMFHLDLQLSVYAATDTAAETLLDSLQTALLAANYDTDTHRFLGIKSLGRRDFEPSATEDEIGLIEEFELWFEKK